MLFTLKYFIPFPFFFATVIMVAIYGANANNDTISIQTNDIQNNINNHLIQKREIIYDSLFHDFVDTQLHVRKRREEPDDQNGEEEPVNLDGGDGEMNGEEDPQAAKKASKDHNKSNKKHIKSEKPDDQNDEGEPANSEGGDGEMSGEKNPKTAKKNHDKLNDKDNKKHKMSKKPDDEGDEEKTVNSEGGNGEKSSEKDQKEAKKTLKQEEEPVDSESEGGDAEMSDEKDPKAVKEALKRLEHHGNPKNKVRPRSRHRYGVDDEDNREYLTYMRHGGVASIEEVYNGVMPVDHQMEMPVDCVGGDCGGAAPAKFDDEQSEEEGGDAPAEYDDGNGYNPEMGHVDHHIHLTNMRHYGMAIVDDNVVDD